MGVNVRAAHAGFRCFPLLWLIVSVILWSAPATTAEQDSVPSRWVGVCPLTVRPGPNFIASPVQGFTVYRGLVTSVTGSEISVESPPGWADSALAAVSVGGIRFPQYLLCLTADSSAAAGGGNAGQWWAIAGNTAEAITVDPDGSDLAAAIGAGDVIEIQRLVSIRDLLGYGDGCPLVVDSNGFPSKQEEDIIRYVRGTSFTHEMFYHDGSLTGGAAGYVIDGVGPVDGSQITLLPGQPIMVFRRTDSAAATRTVAGQFQTDTWVRKLWPGANAVALPWAVAVAVGDSGLAEGGWTVDSDGYGGNDDRIRCVNGTSFGDEIYYHDGTYHGGVPGWVVNNSFDDGYPLEPGRGYIVFRESDVGLRWRLPPPVALEMLK